LPSGHAPAAAGTRPQQLGLGRFVAGAEEPAAQALPPLLPGLPIALPRIRLLARIARRGIARLALGDLGQQGVDVRLEVDDAAGDGIGPADKIADEALQIVDQPPLVAGNRRRLGLLQLDAARHARHEGLGILRQALEHAHQVAQDRVGLGDVRLGLGNQGLKRLEAAGDVLERYRLQLRAALQRLHEHGQRRFHGLAAVRQPVKEAGAVEVAERGDAGGVGMRFEVAPRRELGQSGRHVLDARLGPAWRASPVGIGQDLVGPELQAILPLRGREHVHDAAIERSLFRAQMAKQLGRFVRDLHAVHLGESCSVFSLFSRFVKEGWNKIQLQERS